MSVTFADLLDAGLSRRQIHTWSEAGHLRAYERRMSGSGHPRTWPDRELAIAVLILRLTAAGLTLEAAAATARGDHALHMLAPGVWVMVVDPSTDAAIKEEQAAA